MNNLNNTNNTLIDNYIQRVTELSHSTQRIPNEDELVKIALELGINEEEIENAKKRSQDHFVRAQGYMTVKHWDDAIAELQDAVVFNPSNLDMLLNLVKSHFGLWKEHHKQEDEDKIRLRIKQCLEVKPDAEEALLLLAELDRQIKMRKLFIILASFFGISCVAGSIIIFFFLNIDPLFFIRKESKIDQLNREFTTEIQLLKTDINNLQNEINELKQTNNNQSVNLEEQTQKIAEKTNENQAQIDQLKNKLNEVITKVNKLDQP
jgi:hypothetical protein